MIDSELLGRAISSKSMTPFESGQMARFVSAARAMAAETQERFDALSCPADVPQDVWILSQKMIREQAAASGRVTGELVVATLAGKVMPKPDGWSDAEWLALKSEVAQAVRAEILPAVAKSVREAVREAGL